MGLDPHPDPAPPARPRPVAYARPPRTFTGMYMLAAIPLTYAAVAALLAWTQKYENPPAPARAKR